MRPADHATLRPVQGRPSAFSLSCSDRLRRGTFHGPFTQQSFTQRSFTQRSFTQRSFARCRLILGLVVGLLLSAGSALATPQLDGDIDPLFQVNPADCPSCTAGQLDTLQNGLGLLLGEIRKEAVDSQVCVAQASLARDMALVSFEAYRSGAITEGRWRDSLRAKGRFAGAVAELTVDAMVRSYREALAERLGVPIPQGSLQALQTDIYASGQFSKIFTAMAHGQWHDQWMAILNDGSGGFNPVVDAVLNLEWSSRHTFNVVLVNSRPSTLWREAQLAVLTQLRDDFLVGSVAAERDQLLADYDAAMAAEPWIVMGWGCGTSAAAGFRQHAIDLSQGLIINIRRTKEGPGQTTFDQDQGPEVSIEIIIEDEIDVVATDPDSEDTTEEIEDPPPPHNPPSDRTPDTTGGEEPNPPGGGTQIPETTDPPCDEGKETLWMQRITFGMCPCSSTFADCRMSSAFANFHFQKCVNQTQPHMQSGCEGPGTPPPPPPGEGPGTNILTSCREQCAPLGVESIRVTNGGNRSGGATGGTTGFSVNYNLGDNWSVSCTCELP